MFWDFAMARRRHETAAALEKLFDKGTFELSGNTLIRGYYAFPIASGLFHGRPASISTVGNMISVRVSGHFYTPFELRRKRSRLSDLIDQANNPLLAFPFLYVLTMFSVAGGSIFGVSPWKAVIAMLVFFFTAYLLHAACSKLLGYDSTPKDSRGELSFADSAPLKYLTYVPERFLPIIERPEIRNVVVHLIGEFPIYLLKSDGEIAGHNKAFRKYGLGGTLEAKSVHRRKLLDQETVREVLTELSMLCGNIEAVGGEEESLGPVVSEVR
jgi:hypothetical protein